MSRKQVEHPPIRALEVDETQFGDDGWKESIQRDWDAKYGLDKSL